MNSSSLRRLASDHASLHKDGLPPNYLFPSHDDQGALPDDLTQFTILLTGAHGTPYSQGLWRLFLKMPEDYPKSPPKASFRTRIWHPNVEELTGAVCVDTLKKDWESKLTLRDILVTISCLLINPNPDSALNSASGSLLQDDYEAFARQAKLMTSIHAPIPKNMKVAVQAAKRRGEDAGMQIREETEERPVAPRASSSTTSVIMKKRPQLLRPQTASSASEIGLSRSATGRTDAPPAAVAEVSDDEEEHDPAKENDPSLSPSPVSFAPPSPRKNVLGKRPLSSLPTPLDPDCDILDEESQATCDTTSSEKNIAANLQTPQSAIGKEGPPKKSPKLMELSKGVNVSGRIRDDHDPLNDIHEDNTAEDAKPASNGQGEGKENFGTVLKEVSVPLKKAVVTSTSAVSTSGQSAMRKISTASQSSGKGKARVGVRRL